MISPAELEQIDALIAEMATYDSYYTQAEVAVRQTLAKRLQSLRAQLATAATCEHCRHFTAHTDEYHLCSMLPCECGTATVPATVHGQPFGCVAFTKKET